MARDFFDKGNLSRRTSFYDFKFSAFKRLWTRFKWTR